MAYYTDGMVCVNLDHIAAVIPQQPGTPGFQIILSVPYGGSPRWGGPFKIDITPAQRAALAPILAKLK